MKTKKILKTQGWTVKTWRGMKNMKEKFAVSENWGLCSLWTVFSGKALGYFFGVKSYQLTISPGPFAAICVCCQMVCHLFASPVEAHQPIFASKQPVIFSHVPSLSLSMQLDGGIWAKEARWGRRLETWEHRALCWMKKQERQAVQSMKKTGSMAIPKIVKPAQEM